VWRRVGCPGLERFELRRENTGWSLGGTVVLVHEGEAAEARYAVACDGSWRTRWAEVTCTCGAATRTLELTVTGDRWLEAGREHREVRGAVDVDLGWTPATNTLPIRRLGLRPGQRSGIVTAAWVRFPTLQLEPLPQEYERLDERRYRYTSGGGIFSAELSVDEEGLVVDYGDLWERVTG
jgi:hypothetical protein